MEAAESHCKIKFLWQAEVLSHLCDGDGKSGGLRRWEERPSLKTKRLRSSAARQAGGRCLHLVGRKMVFWDTVCVSHHCVALIEAPHSIHFIVDAAGDVLNVLHVGPDEEIP